MSAGLAELEERVRAELALTAYPAPHWVRPRSAPSGTALNVLIVGAGQAGLTIAFALSRRGIDRVELVDAAPEGLEGPWVTYARMHTLRTPKHLTGPDQGVPALTPESWYRARFGDAEWEQLGHLPKEHWQEYLGWFRGVTGAVVHNETRVVGIRPDGDLLAVDLEAPAGTRTLLARRVVLATGMDGNGEWSVPPVIAEALPRHRYSHTGERFDVGRLTGKRIGVLGGGASGFDYAASALEAGAASADLFFRRAEVPRVNPFRWMEFYAFGAHFPDLPDGDKWRFTVRFSQTNQPPPQQTWYRCTRFDTFTWHTASPWSAVREDGDDIVITTPTGEFRVDHVVAATGPSVDLAVRPELATLRGAVALWADRFTPPADWADPALERYPYLGPGFDFTERVPGEAPWVAKVYDFTYGARLSMGLNGNMNSGLGAGGRRIADALSRSLFLEDRDEFFEDYRTYAVAELVDTGRPGEAADGA